MAAGQGFKTFITGEVLTAGDVNGYLMQGINVFTNATARDAAITAPAEGQFAFTKDNNSLWYYDGAAWVASGATGDIEGVTVSSPLTGGGTSGTVNVGILSGTTSNLGAVQLSDSTSSTSTTLAATANAVKTTFDLANGAIPKSTVTTSGDIIYATGASTVTRRGIGSTGDVLTVSGGVPTWAAPAGGGKVKQVVFNTYSTVVNNATNTFTDTGLNATITPTASNSKILVLITHNGCRVSTSSVFWAGKLLRNGAEIQLIGDTLLENGSGEARGSIAANFLDSPATTSTLTYKTTFCSRSNSGTVSAQYNEYTGNTSTMTLIEIGA
jgi:hypothetical protein